VSRKSQFKSTLTEQSLRNFSLNKFFYLHDTEIDFFVLVDTNNSSLRYISNYYGLKEHQKSGVLSISNDGPLEYHAMGNE